MSYIFSNIEFTKNKISRKPYHVNVEISNVFSILNILFLLIWTIGSLLFYILDFGSLILIQISYYFILLSSLFNITIIIVKRKLNIKYTYLLLFLFLYPILATMLQSAFYGAAIDPITKKTSAGLISDILITMMTSFLIGCFIAKTRIISTSLSLLIYALLIYGLSEITSAAFLINWIEINERFSSETFASHLLLELQIVTLVVYLLSATSLTLKNLTFIISTIIIWSTGGRTLLASFVLSFILFNNSKISDKIKVFILFLTIFSSIYLLFLSSNDDVFVTRMLFSEGLENDLSSTARSSANYFVIENLSRYIFIGNINLHIDYFGDFGLYSHNIMSALQFFGIIYLIFLIIAIFLSFKYLLGNKINNHESKIVFLGLILLGTSALGLISGKYFGTPLLWAAFGFVFIQTTKR